MGHLQTGVVKNPDPDLDEEVWEQTLEEVSNRWTWLDEEYETSKHLIAERFGLWQGDKMRFIDNCTGGGLTLPVEFAKG